VIYIPWHIFPNLLLLRTLSSGQFKLSAMAILRHKLFDVHVRVYHFLVGMANFLSPAIRPSVERLLASCGDRYLGKDLLIGLTHIYQATLTTVLNQTQI
jgi:hypothetical protein